MSKFMMLFNDFLWIAAVVLILIILLRYYFISKKKQNNSENIAVNDETKETIQTITVEYSELISSSFIRINLLYSNIIRDLAIQDYVLLQKNKRKLKKLNAEVEILKDGVLVYLQSKISSPEVSQFYILTLENMEDMVGAMDQILTYSKSHITKDHKKLTFNQIRDLKSIDVQSSNLFSKIDEAINQNDFNSFEELSNEANNLVIRIDTMLEAHINKINSNTGNPKNFKLYTKLLRKSNELFGYLIEILNRYKNVHQQ